MKSNISLYSEVESDGLKMLCVSYSWPIAPIYFICLTLKTFNFVTSGLGRKQWGVYAILHQTTQYSPLSDQLLKGMIVVSQPTEQEAADGSKQGYFPK